MSNNFKVQGGLELPTVLYYPPLYPGEGPPLNNGERSLGTRIVLWPEVEYELGHADYAIGIDSYTLWQSVPVTPSSGLDAWFRWYASDQVILSLKNDGTLYLTNKLTFSSNKDFNVVNAPTSSTGVSGDKKGDVAFDDNYFYYCKENFGGIRHPAIHGINSGSANGVDEGYIVYNDYLHPSPQAGGKVYYNNEVRTITQVDTSNAGVWVIFVDNALVIEAQAEFEYGPEPSLNIWKRIAWSNDTW